MLLVVNQEGGCIAHLLLTDLTCLSRAAKGELFRIDRAHFVATVGANVAACFSLSRLALGPVPH